MQFDFQLVKWWKRKLPAHSDYLIGLHQESYEAMKTIISMVETDWKSAIEREPICVETPPFAKTAKRKYTMASAEEFLQLKQENPDVIVRKLNAEEMQQLTAQEEEL